MEYNEISLSVSKVKELLKELDANWGAYVGNYKQISLAEKIGISHLGQLFSALSSLGNKKGTPWAEVLGYNKIELPASKIKSFFNDFIDFVGINNLPLRRFSREFLNLPLKTCKRRFLEIKKNFDIVRQTIEGRRRADWPEEFYNYLLRTLLFLPASENPKAATEEILDYIEQEEDRIDQVLRRLPEDEEVCYALLRPHFGKFTIPVVEFCGNLTSIEGLREAKLREPLYFNLPASGAKSRDEDYNNVPGPLGQTPLDLALLKEEMEV